MTPREIDAHLRRTLRAIDIREHLADRRAIGRFDTAGGNRATVVPSVARVQPQGANRPYRAVR